MTLRLSDLQVNVPVSLYDRLVELSKMSGRDFVPYVQYIIDDDSLRERDWEGLPESASALLALYRFCFEDLCITNKAWRHLSEN